MVYTVTNVYGIAGESNHCTPEAAIKAAAKREGDGWIVLDENGMQWTRNGPEDPVATEYRGYRSREEKERKASLEAVAWRKLASSPQTALMLGSTLDPNDPTVDWVVECTRLVNEQRANRGEGEIVRDACKEEIKERLAYLRGELEAERISYGELAELQALSEHIDPGDVMLLEWAGVPEGGLGTEFEVEVQRTEYRNHVFTVRAATAKEAEEIAMDGLSPDYDFGDSPVKYAKEEVVSVRVKTT